MTVRVEQTGAIWVLRIDRASKHNAIDAGTTAAFDEALNAFEDEPQARVGIITGGPEMFSAGSDIRVSAGTPTPRGGPYGIAARRSAKPLLSAVEGLAAGGGFEIALSTGCIIASRTASLCFPEVDLGLVAECGGLFRALRSLPPNIARELLLTGLPLSAERGCQLGLVNHLTEPGETLTRALELANVIATRAPLAVAETFRVLETVDRRTDDEDWALTRAASERVRVSRDSEEGIRAFLERRSPEWTGR